MPDQISAETAESLRRAIEGLRVSTRLIQHHSKIVQEQNEFLKTHCKGCETTTDRFESQVQNQQGLELQHLKAVNYELSQSIELRIQNHREKVDQGRKVRPAILNETLRTHNRKIETLERLNHIEKGLLPSTLAKQQPRIETLLAALHCLIKEGAKLRLSRIYLEVLETNTITNPEDESCNTTEIKEVEDDLANLHAEIHDVTEILVNHDHAQHLSNLSNQINDLQHSNSVNLGQHISVELGSLSQVLEEIYDHNQMLQSHRLAIGRFGETQDRIKAMYDMNTTSDSHMTKADQAALEMLRQYLKHSEGINNHTNHQVVEDSRQTLQQLLEGIGSESWRMYQTLLMSSVDGLALVGEDLDELDANISKTKGGIDGVLKPGVDSQDMIKKLSFSKG